MKTAFSILLFSAVLFAAPLVADSIAFKIDANHSNIGFSGPISGGFSSVHGKFGKFKMELSFNESDMTKSAVNVVIDSASISTGIDQRDAHLRTADFFDVKNHPEITFRGTGISKVDGKWMLTGDFTMRGVTRQISFPFDIVGQKTNKDNTRIYMGFAARLKIDRTKYNVNYQHQSVPDFIGNEVEI